MRPRQWLLVAFGWAFVLVAFWWNHNLLVKGWRYEIAGWVTWVYPLTHPYFSFEGYVVLFVALLIGGLLIKHKYINKYMELPWIIGVPWIIGAALTLTGILTVLWIEFAMY